MAAVNNLSPEQLRMASEQMRNMSPETLQEQAANYGNHLKGEEAYKVNGSQQLKTEGNALHAAGNYAAAMAKYQRALDNLQCMVSGRVVFGKRVFGSVCVGIHVCESLHR